MKTPVALILSLFLTFLVGNSLSQEFPKPDYNKGYRCDYESNSRVAGIVQQEFVEIFPDGGFKLLVKDGRGLSTRIYNNDHQLLERDGIKYSPAFVMPNYPLKAGITGGGKFSYPHPRQQGVTVYAESSVASSVFEKGVRVPAGIFDTIKIEVVTTYRLSSGYSSSMVQIAWFPTDSKIKRYVMMKFVDRSGGPEEIHQLIACGETSEMK